MQPIGVFDSGVGGLSVLRALRAELPHENFVYVADSGYAPYGEKDAHHVIERAHAITHYLQHEHQAKAIVVACNTATAIAIQSLRQQYSPVPIVGIEPALKPASTLSKTGIVGVMATRSTLNSEKFRALLHACQGSTKFVLQACDGLAFAIEHGDSAKIAASCMEHTNAMGTFGTHSGAIDTLVLGCTHYPFVQAELVNLVGSTVTFIEGGTPVARQVRRVLSTHVNEALATQTRGHAPGSLACFTTGNAILLEASLRQWLHLETLVHGLILRR